MLPKETDTKEIKQNKRKGKEISLLEIKEINLGRFWYISKGKARLRGHRRFHLFPGGERSKVEDSKVGCQKVG